METEPTSSKKKSAMGMKGIIIAIVVIIIVVAGGYFAWSKGLVSMSAQTGKTVATVNGQPIYQHDVDVRFNQLKDSYTSNGVNLQDKATVDGINKQIVQELVNENLVLQDAQKQGITTTDAEVKSATDQLQATAGSPDALNKQIQQFGMSQGDLTTTVKRNLILQKYIDKFTAGQNITVSQDEIAAAYKAEVGNATSAPALKDVQAQVEQQVKSQKVSQLLLGLIDQLKQNAKITVM